MGQTEYLAKYEKENLRQIRLKINRKTEPELLEGIEKQDNIQGYSKRLILEDLPSDPDPDPGSPCSDCVSSGVPSVLHPNTRITIYRIAI